MTNEAKDKGIPGFIGWSDADRCDNGMGPNPVLEEANRELLEVLAKLDPAKNRNGILYMEAEDNGKGFEWSYRGTICCAASGKGVYAALIEDSVISGENMRKIIGTKEGQIINF